MPFPPHHPFRSAAARDRFLALYDERAKRWPVPCQERFVDTSFGKTFVRISGPEDGVPLVLLHGATASSLMWVPNIRALSEAFRVFAIDAVYDWGKSVYTKLPKDGEEMGIWLGEVLDGLGLRAGVHLAGISLGGWVAAEFALRRPERLRSVILLGPGNVVLPLAWSVIVRLLSMLIPHPYFVRSYCSWMFADSVQQGGEGKKLVDEFAHDTFVAKQCFPMKPVPKPRVFDDAELAGISVPALFLVGENEKIYSAADAIARLGRVAPQIETEVIKNAGHDLTFGQPKAVNEKIIAFARRY